jgi:hypothetical protein
MRLGLSLALANRGPSTGGGAPPPAGGTIDLLWDGDLEPLIPVLSLDFPDPQVGDVVKLRRYIAGNYSSYDEATDTITSAPPDPVSPLDFDFGGNWPLDDYEVWAEQLRAAVQINTSNIEAVSITGDITAPILTLQEATVVTSTTATGAVTTNENDGTLFFIASTDVTAATKAQVESGQMHTGAAAAFADDQPVTAAGVQPVNFTGLTPGNTLYPQYMHKDAAGNQSDVVVVTDGFSTGPLLTLPTDAATSATTSSASVSTDTDNGTLFAVTTLSPTKPTALQVENGQNHLGAVTNNKSQAVTVIGVQNITGGFTGHTELTQGYTYFMHKAASGNRSSVSAADGFTTPAAYVATGVLFDGTNDYMKRGADLTGAGSSKLLTVSFWYKSGSDAASYRGVIIPASTINGSGGVNGGVTKTDTHNFRLHWCNSGNTPILDIKSSNNALQIADGWVHCIASVDLSNTGKRHLYMNDVSDLTVTTYTDALMDFASIIADWGVGGAPSGGTKMFGDLAELYFAPGQYIDLSVEANRRKFRSAIGKPADLGSDGSTPTGTAPLIFFKGGATGWATNAGTGGAFTITGTLTDSSTSP